MAWLYREQQLALHWGDCHSLGVRGQFLDPGFSLPSSLPLGKCEEYLMSLLAPSPFPCVFFDSCAWKVLSVCRVVLKAGLCTSHTPPARCSAVQRVLPLASRSVGKGTVVLLESQGRIPGRGVLMGKSHMHLGLFEMGALALDKSVKVCCECCRRVGKEAWKHCK